MPPHSTHSALGPKPLWQVLCIVRIYYSMPTILDGIRTGSLSAGRPNHLLPSSLYSLMGRTSDQAQYLGWYHSMNGGIPFLVAHILEYELRGEVGLLSLIYFMRSTLPIDECQ
jgi:hypothetical protein